MKPYKRYLFALLFLITLIPLSTVFWSKFAPQSVLSLIGNMTGHTLSAETIVFTVWSPGVSAEKLIVSDEQEIPIATLGELNFQTSWSTALSMDSHVSTLYKALSDSTLTLRDTHISLPDGESLTIAQLAKVQNDNVDHIELMVDVHYRDMASDLPVKGTIVLSFQDAASGSRVPHIALNIPSLDLRALAQNDNTEDNSASQEPINLQPVFDVEPMIVSLQSKQLVLPEVTIAPLNARVVVERDRGLKLSHSLQATIADYAIDTHGTVELNDNQLNLVLDKLHINQSDIAGTMAVTFDNNPANITHIHYDLSSSLLDIPKTVTIDKPAADKQGAQQQTAKTLFNVQPLPLKQLDQWQIEGTLNVEALRYHGRTLFH